MIKSLLKTLSNIYNRLFSYLTILIIKSFINLDLYNISITALNQFIY